MGKSLEGRPQVQACARACSLPGGACREGAALWAPVPCPSWLPPRTPLALQQEVEQWIAAWRAANVDPPLGDGHPLADWPDEDYSTVGNDAGEAIIDAGNVGSSREGSSEAAVPSSTTGSSDDGGSSASPAGAEPAPLVLAAAPGPAAIVRVTEPHLPPTAAAVLSSSAGSAAVVPASAGAPAPAASTPATGGSTGWMRLGMPAERLGAPGEAGPAQQHARQAQQTQRANSVAKPRRAARPVPVVRPQPPSLLARLSASAPARAPATRPASSPAPQPLASPSPSASPSASASASAKELEAAYKQRIAAVLADSKLSSSGGSATQSRRPAAAAGALTSAHQARSKVGRPCWHPRMLRPAVAVHGFRHARQQTGVVLQLLIS